MQPVPKTNYNEIIEILRTFKTRDTKHVFALGEYKRESERVADKNPAVGYSALGAIACVEHRTAAMHANHQKALLLAPSAWTYRNYVASLECAFLWEAAAEYALKAYEFDPTDVALLETYIVAVPFSGKFSLLDSAFQKWSKLHKGNVHPMKDKVAAVNEFLHRTGLSEADLSAALTAVCTALSKSDLCMGQFGFDLVNYGGRDYLAYEILVENEDVELHLYQGMIPSALTKALIPPTTTDHLLFDLTARSEAPASANLFSFIDDDTDHTLVSPNLEQLRLIADLVDGVEL